MRAFSTALRSAGVAASSCSDAGALPIAPLPPSLPPAAGAGVVLVPCFFEPAAALSWARRMTSRQLPYWSASAASSDSASRYSFCV